MDQPRRYALYYVPEPGSALARLGNAVLGYDSATGAEVPRPEGMPGLPAITGSPRAYGFHATLAPPLRLAPGTDEAALLEAVRALATSHPPVPVGRLVVATLGGFTALVQAEPAPAVDMLAAECVAALDRFRAPLTEAERARRRPERLDARGRALLDRWGYPHVFEAFRFHMTLTDALPEAEREPWRERLAAAFSGIDPLTVAAVTLLAQDGRDPFRVIACVPFET